MATVRREARGAGIAHLIKPHRARQAPARGSFGNDAHALATAAGYRFQDDGIAHAAAGEPPPAFGWDRRCRNSGDVGAARELFARRVRAHEFHRLGSRSDAGHTRLGASAGERGICGKTTIVGMERVTAGLCGHVHQFLEAQNAHSATPAIGDHDLLEHRRLSSQADSITRAGASQDSVLLPCSNVRGA